MKKLFLIFTAAVLVAVCISACSSGNTPGASSGDRIRIVATVFPEYDWVMNVLGDDASNADVTLLLDSGVDLHSFQPSADDIMKISDCDLFIYVGGESDQWVEGVLKEAFNKDMKVINLLDVLGSSAKEEEAVEGMQEEDEPEEETEYDEHVWLSLRNASLFASRISEELQAIDPEHADKYKSNAAGYIKKLDDLDKEYISAVSSAKEDTLVFGDRFPFRYLVDDYGLNYYAAFAGCSAETEASFDTISFLAGKVDELSLRAVMTIDGSDHRIAEVIVQNTTAKDQQILTLDSMQSVKAEDVKNGTTYLSIMEKDLDVLKEALK
ncbi:MAG: metal ABC transporter substrate-binding protein [Lachnospiraceae bacterium]|nr:metal ABC transporter substrate-binding protein [Lachnospiraceae bacterium]